MNSVINCRLLRLFHKAKTIPINGSGPHSFQQKLQEKRCIRNVQNEETVRTKPASAANECISHRNAKRNVFLVLSFSVNRIITAEKCGKLIARNARYARHSKHSLERKWISQSSVCVCVCNAKRRLKQEKEKKPNPNTVANVLIELNTRLSSSLHWPNLFNTLPNTQHRYKIRKPATAFGFSCIISHKQWCSESWEFPQRIYILSMFYFVKTILAHRAVRYHRLPSKLLEFAPKIASRFYLQPKTNSGL